MARMGGIVPMTPGISLPVIMSAEEHEFARAGGEASQLFEQNVLALGETQFDLPEPIIKA